VKGFRSELRRFQRKIAAHEPFALARFNDGEKAILFGERDIHHVEYSFHRNEKLYERARGELRAALTYRHDRYFVGIGVPPAVAANDFRRLRDESGQDLEHLTYAALVYVSNYRHYRDDVVPLFREYETIIVCSRDATTETLPFRVTRAHRVGRDAWVRDRKLVDVLRREIDRRRTRGALFLLCAGPFGSILAHQLNAHCDENTYLDAGSSLDRELFPGRVTRRYLWMDEDRRRCRWT
jgi:hypothetical protein